MSLGDEVVKSRSVLRSGTLVLALLLLLGLDKLRSLVLGGKLGDAGVLEVVEAVLLVKLILVGGKVVLVLVILGVVVLLVAVGVVRLNVVSGKVDGVSSVNDEPNTLVLANGDVESLLVVLWSGDQ